MYRLSRHTGVTVRSWDERLARKEAIVHVRIRGAAPTKDLRKKRTV